VPHQATFAQSMMGAESFVVCMVVAPDDVAADHTGPLSVSGVVGSVERVVIIDLRYGEDGPGGAASHGYLAR
jgi:hypothetical protein